MYHTDLLINKPIVIINYTLMTQLIIITPFDSHMSHKKYIDDKSSIIKCFTDNVLNFK